MDSIKLNGSNLKRHSSFYQTADLKKKVCARVHVCMHVFMCVCIYI